MNVFLFYPSIINLITDSSYFWSGIQTLADDSGKFFTSTGAPADTTVTGFNFLVQSGYQFNLAIIVQN